jgi:hypothetical protein
MTSAQSVASQERNDFRRSAEYQPYPVLIGKRWIDP